MLGGCGTNAVGCPGANGRPIPAYQRGERLARLEDTQIMRTLPRGHVAAVLDTARERNLALAMIVPQLIDPAVGDSLDRASVIRWDPSSVRLVASNRPLHDGRVRSGTLTARTFSRLTDRRSHGPDRPASRPASSGWS